MADCVPGSYLLHYLYRHGWDKNVLRSRFPLKLEGLGLWLEVDGGWEVGKPIGLDAIQKNERFTSPEKS